MSGHRDTAIAGRPVGRIKPRGGTAPADTPHRTLHVVVPHEAWRRARTAALDSGLAFKAYMALLLLSARPLRPKGDASDGTATVVPDAAPRQSILVIDPA